MENQNIQLEESVSIKDLFFDCLSKWYWFAGAAAVALFVAFIYVQSQQPVFTRYTEVMIKEDKKGTSIGSNVTSALADLGFMSTESNVYNEQKALQSPAVMSEVVKRLRLDMNYSVRQGLRRQVLYGTNLPFTVQLLDVTENQFAEFEMTVDRDGQITMSNFILDRDEFDHSATGKLGDTIVSPIGKLTVMPTTFYIPDSIDYKDINVFKTSVYSATRAYTGALSIELVDKYSTVLSLTINDYSVQRADNILNTLIAVYNEKWVQDKNQIAISTSNFIDKRLIIIGNELGVVDEGVADFKSRNLMPDIQAASSMYMNQAMRTNSELVALNTQLQIANYVRDYLNDAATAKQLLPAGVIVEDQSISSQISQYNTQLLARNNLVASSSERNALVVNMDEALNSMRRAIQESVSNLIVTLETQIASVQREENKTNARIASSPNQAKQLITIERQQKIKEALYLFLLQKREENELSQAFTAYNTRVITPPYGSLLPTAPKKRMIFLAALIIGLAVPLVWIYISQILDVTVRGRKDIDCLTIPFVGEIPLSYKRRKKFFVKRKFIDTTPIVVKDKGRNAINEAFRVARTHLEFMLNRDNTPKVVMVSSFNPGSGKTFLSMNLATAFAVKDKKVLVVDMDMRKASLSKYVNSPKTGVSNWLVGYEDSLDKIIVKGQTHPNLDIIPVGTIPPNPTELLTDAKLTELFETLRKKYDYVFIDCPPIEIVADAAIINAHVDITLFAVRAGLLNRSMLPELQRIYDEKKYRNINLILNGTEEVLSRYGYSRYGYHYGYKYGYGYGHGKYSTYGEEDRKVN